MDKRFHRLFGMPASKSAIDSPCTVTSGSEGDGVGNSCASKSEIRLEMDYNVAVTSVRSAALNASGLSTTLTFDPKCVSSGRVTNSSVLPVEQSLATEFGLSTATSESAGFSRSSAVRHQEFNTCNNNYNSSNNNKSCSTGSGAERVMVVSGQLLPIRRGVSNTCGEMTAAESLLPKSDKNDAGILEMGPQLQYDSAAFCMARQRAMLAVCVLSLVVQTLVAIMSKCRHIVWSAVSRPSQVCRVQTD